MPCRIQWIFQTLAPWNSFHEFGNRCEFQGKALLLKSSWKESTLRLSQIPFPVQGRGPVNIYYNRTDVKDQFPSLKNLFLEETSQLWECIVGFLLLSSLNFSWVSWYYILPSVANIYSMWENASLLLDTLWEHVGNIRFLGGVGRVQIVNFQPIFGEELGPIPGLLFATNICDLLY